MQEVCEKAAGADQAPESPRVCVSEVSIKSREIKPGIYSHLILNTDGKHTAERTVLSTGNQGKTRQQGLC